MHFNNLPDDVIQIVFYIHVRKHLEERVSLLLTCRRWHSVAINFSALWNSVYIGSSTSSHSHKGRIVTLDGLLHAIDRTGSATFELEFSLQYTLFRKYIGHVVRYIKRNDWLSRCKSLTLTPCQDESQDNDESIVQHILSNVNFDALESLQWSDYQNVRWSDAYSTLLARAESSAPRLRALKLDYNSRFTPSNIFPPRYVGLYGRIQRLYLSFVGCPVPWGEFHELEHLDMTCLSRYAKTAGNELPGAYNLSGLIAPRLTGLCLAGASKSTNFPRKMLLKQLKLLILRRFYVDKPESLFPSSFPSLLFLGVQPDALHPSIYSVSADKLEELVVYYRDDIGFYPPLKGIACSPRILRLDVVKHDEFSEATYKTSAWSELEELHLTIIAVRQTIPQMLIDDLSGKVPERCPQLKVLTVSRRNWRGTVSPTIKLAGIQELRDIETGRRKAGFPSLERGDIGWYRSTLSGWDLRDPPTQERVTEWVDCLRDWEP